LGAASPSMFGHCPHPSNRWAEGFTNCPVILMLVEIPKPGKEHQAV